LLNEKESRLNRKDFALAVAVHVSPKGLRFAELEGTKPTFIDLPTLVFSILSAAFLFPIACNKNNQFKQLG